MEILLKLSSVSRRVGGVSRRVGAVAGGEAVIEMEALTAIERDFLVHPLVYKEQKAATSEYIFLILFFSLSLLTFLGFMIAKRNNRRLLNNGYVVADQPDEEQQMLNANTTADQFEIEANHNQAQRRRHCLCLYTLQAKCNFGTRLAFVNFILEIPSAVLDQIATDKKPTYVLIMMSFSFTSMLLCLVELVYKGRRQRVTWKWRWSSGRKPWFYHPPPSDRPFGTFTEIIGFICAMAQSVVTTINYCVCIRNHAAPIKIQVWPSIFAFGLLCCKFMGKPNEEDGESSASNLSHPTLEPFTPPELQQ